MVTVYKKTTKWPDLEVTVQWHLGSKKSHLLKIANSHFNEVDLNRLKKLFHNKQERGR